MARYTQVRGNPEQKLMVLNTDFSGGVNLMYSDDLLKDNEMRYMMNYELDNTGELRSRKGYSQVDALTTLLYEGVTTIEDFPIISRVDSAIKNIILFRVIQSDNNVWKELSEFKTLAEYQTYHGTDNNKIRLFILAELPNGTVKYWVKSYTIGLATVTKTGATGILPFAFTGKDNLLNVATGEQYGKIFFTSNDSGLVEFDTEANTFKYVGDFTGQTNSAYKPNGIEVRKVGFNVLGDDPLTWIDNSGLTVESIQGVYLTTTDRIPLSSIPTGMTIQVNIIHTGDFHDFTLIFSEYESPIDATVTKNLTLSTTGIAVYDVDFLTKPSTELQINIAFTEPTVFLEDYIDFYEVGAYDTSSKTVETLDIGGYKVIQMYDRLVYYKGNEIWFSDINNFGYVPNFNYLLLQIDQSDEIVKIIFFRTSYMVFTKKSIWKLSGQFEQSTLALSLVNDDVGCISANSIVLVENVLFFMSTRGLRGLKTDTFRENLENMVEFDQKIYPIVPTNNNSYGFVYKDQYILMANNRGPKKSVTIRNRAYDVPDVIKYYYRTGSFSFEGFEADNYPRFIIFEQGEMYSLMDKTVTKFGQGYDDFGKSYKAIFETGGVSVGYPIHEKKFKHVAFKLGGEAEINTIYVETFGDGIKHQDVALTYDAESPDVELESARFMVKKERLPAKCRNLAVRVTIYDAFNTTIQSIGYLFKLGKVREN